MKPHRESVTPEGRDASPGFGWVVGLYALALGLRLFHLWSIVDVPFFNHLYIDPRMYDEWGQRIAAGSLLSDEPFFLDPLYPYFLGAIFAVFGHSYVAAVAAQMILGAAVAPLMMSASRPWFDVAVCRAVGVVAALYLPSVYFDGILMKPGLSVFLVALSLYLLSRALDGGRPRWWAAAGVVLAMACLTRGNLLLVVPVLAVWLLLRAGRDGPERRSLADRLRDRSRWIRIGALAGGVAAVLALPAAHNHAVGGEWILTTSNAGANFYIGNNPTNESGEYQALPFVDPNPQYEQRDFRREAERRAGRPLSHREISRFWFDESFAWIRGHKADWLKVLWRKVGNFWGAYERPDSLDYYLYRQYAPLLRLPLPGFGLLAPLALTGACLLLRRRGWPRLLLILIAVYSLSVIAFFVFSRFRMVIVPALFVLAGYACVECYRRLLAARRERTRPRTLQAVAVALLFAAFFWYVNFPVRSTPDTWSYRLATSAGLEVREETTANSRFNLGVIYHKLALESDDPGPLLVRAETELRAALARNRKMKFYVELGKVLVRQERIHEAIEVYGQAEAFQPGSYYTQHALGLLYGRTGDAARAEQAFRTALERNPRHTASAIQLGRLLLEQQRNEEAARLFRYALGVSPGNAAARRGLARSSTN